VLWTAHAVTTAGSWVTYVVLPLLAYQLTGSAAQTSIVAALEVVPYLLFGLVAGAIADRGRRRAIMVAAELGSGAVLATIPLAGALGVLTVPHVYAAAFAASSLYVWFDAAHSGALPALVGRDRIVPAQSAIWSTATALGIAGPAVGGVLAATLGAANAILVDAVSYALAAALILRIRGSFGATAPDSEEPVVRRTLRDVREGLAYLWRQRTIRALTLLGFGVSFSGGAVTGLLVVYAVEGLGLDEDGAAIGVLFAAGAAGAFLGTLVLPKLTRRVAAGRITLLTLLVDVMLLGAIALAPTLPAALVAYAGWSAAHMVVVLNGITYRQRVTPDRLQGRVNVTARMIAWGGAPFGAAVGGLVAEATSVRSALVVMAVGVGASAAAAWFTPLRHREDAPAAGEVEPA
jgi:MFS family permease